MPGAAALAENLSGDHGVELFAVVELGKLLLIAIERDMHVTARAGLEDGLHLVIRLIIEVVRR
ncbi:hypothetical protein D3C81_1818060 [compost metagenome]